MSEPYYDMEVWFSLEEVEEYQWKYELTFVNTGSDAIEDIVIWFDFELGDITDYEAPPDWDPLICYPNTLLQVGAGFDVLNETTPLASGTSLSGFSVSFQYTGNSAILSAPMFEIYDPADWSLVASGASILIIPELCSISILAIGGLFNLAGSLRYNRKATTKALSQTLLTNRWVV